jgi:hypothetical protein
MWQEKTQVAPGMRRVEAYGLCGTVHGNVGEFAGAGRFAPGLAVRADPSGEARGWANLGGCRADQGTVGDGLDGEAPQIVNVSQMEDDTRRCVGLPEEHTASDQVVRFVARGGDDAPILGRNIEFAAHGRTLPAPFSDHCQRLLRFHRWVVQKVRYSDRRRCRVVIRLTCRR